MNFTIIGANINNLSGDILKKTSLNVTEMIVVLNEILTGYLPTINSKIPLLSIPSFFGVSLGQLLA